MTTAVWPDWAHLTWSGPKVKATLPPTSFFKFPPSPHPTTLPPPPNHSTFAHPFTIPTEWYNAVLSPNVPITFALVYASVITYLNSVNKRRNNKPWAISKSPLFTLFVLLHNLFLTLYSGWTFVGMLNALRTSVTYWNGDYGLAGTVDSFCKINGPRGMGSAATFNETGNSWGISNRLYHLTQGTLTPEASDVGRIWNEGLAFYGWLFYLSKFYEVVDTLIIIAKGKKSSFLQTYHHAGAMLCMWAGIRYMSPPIWLFVFENSFIHTIMYAFYFCTALNIHIPKPIKQTLTTLQITQFVVGFSFAFLHLFVAYQVPVSVPYLYYLGDSAKSIASSVASDASSIISTATAAASADAASWLKKLALRAAGREGLAENVLNEQGRTFGVDAVHAAKDFASREETRYRDELRWVHCLDTSGQTFAVYLNLFYLLPLTGLFLNFFIKSYIKRADQKRRRSIGESAYIAGQSLDDARKGVGRRLSEAFENYQGTNGDLNGEDVISGEEVKQNVKELGDKAKTAAKDGGAKVRAEIQQLRESAKSASKKAHESAIESDTVENVKNSAQRTVTSTKETVSNISSQAQETVKSSTSQETKEKVSEALQNASSQAEKAVNKAEEVVADAGKETPRQVEQAKQKATKVKDKVVEKTPEVKEGVQKTAERIKGEAKPVVDEVSEKANKASKEVEEKGADTSEAIEGKADEASKSENRLSKRPSQTSSSRSSGFGMFDFEDSDDNSGEQKGEKSGSRGEKEEKEEKEEKQEQDKIIDESETLREKVVDTNSKSEEADSHDNHVRDDTTYAEVVKGGEDDDGEMVEKDEGKQSDAAQIPQDTQSSPTKNLQERVDGDTTASFDKGRRSKSQSLSSSTTSFENIPSESAKSDMNIDLDVSTPDALPDIDPFPLISGTDPHPSSTSASSPSSKQAPHNAVEENMPKNEDEKQTRLPNHSASSREGNEEDITDDNKQQASLNATKKLSSIPVPVLRSKQSARGDTTNETRDHKDESGPVENKSSHKNMASSIATPTVGNGNSFGLGKDFRTSIPAPTERQRSTSPRKETPRSPRVSGGWHAKRRGRESPKVDRFCDAEDGIEGESEEIQEINKGTQ